MSAAVSPDQLRLAPTETTPPCFRRGQCVLIDLAARSNGVDGWGGSVLADDGLAVRLDVIAYGLDGRWCAADCLPMTVTIPWDAIDVARVFEATS